MVIFIIIAILLFPVNGYISIDRNRVASKSINIVSKETVSGVLVNPELYF
jgi:hypothetical protein